MSLKERESTGSARMGNCAYGEAVKIIAQGFNPKAPREEGSSSKKAQNAQKRVSREHVGTGLQNGISRNRRRQGYVGQERARRSQKQLDNKPLKWAEIRMRTLGRQWRIPWI